MDPRDIFFYATAYATLFVSIFWFTIYFLADKKQNKTGLLKPLTILVPAYNEEKSIARCLRSLLDQDYPGLKIFVVDDGSTDKTASVVKKFARNGKNITYILKRHSGKAASLNAGLRHVKTGLFGFIDSDTFLSKNALRNMVGHIDGKTAAVIASIRPYRPKRMIEKIQQVEYLVSSFTRKLMSFIDSLYYTPGFAIYNTSVIKRLGGFDENNITEDLEIGMRLKNHGYNIANSIDDRAYTRVPRTFRALFRQRMRWYRGYIYNTKKYSHMFFNKKFGDLGIIVLPIQYIVLAMIIPLFLFALYDNSILITQGLIDVFLVDFDIRYLASTTRLNVITTTTFYLVATVVAFFFMIGLSEKKVKDKIGKLDYIVYIILYPFINLILWISAFVHEITKAKKEW